MASSAAEAADPFERRDLVLGRAGKFLAGLVELALAVDELAVALLDHVGALVDLLVALEEPPLEVAQLTALRAGLFLGFPLKAQLLVLGLEDQVLLLGPRALDDQGGLLLGLLDPLAREDAAAKETECGAAGEGHEGHHHGHEFHVLLPSGLAACATVVTPAKGPEVMPMTDCGSPAGCVLGRRGRAAATSRLGSGPCAMPNAGAGYRRPAGLVRRRLSDVTKSPFRRFGSGSDDRRIWARISVAPISPRSVRPYSKQGQT